MPAIKTETIFTGTQVFVKLPTGQWKDIHANIADLRTKVKDSASNFNDCTRLPDEKADGKTLAVYTGGDKTDTMSVSTKVWVAGGAIQRSETMSAARPRLMAKYGISICRCTTITRHQSADGFELA